MALVSPAHLSRGVAAAVGHHLHRCFARSVTKDQCFWPTQHRRSARRCPCQLRECTLLVHLLTLLRPSILSSRPLCLQLGLAKHRFAWELRAKRGSARLAFPRCCATPAPFGPRLRLGTALALRLRRAALCVCIACPEIRGHGQLFPLSLHNREVRRSANCWLHRCQCHLTRYLETFSLTYFNLVHPCHSTRLISTHGAGFRRSLRSAGSSNPRSVGVNPERHRPAQHAPHPATCHLPPGLFGKAALGLLLTWC